MIHSRAELAASIQKHNASEATGISGPHGSVKLAGTSCLLRRSHRAAAHVDAYISNRAVALSAASCVNALDTANSHATAA
jgi:hypothetical protein